DLRISPDASRRRTGDRWAMTRFRTMWRRSGVVLLGAAACALGPGPALAAQLPTTSSSRYVVAGTAVVGVGNVVYVGGDFSIVADRTGSAIVLTAARDTLAPVRAEVAGGSVAAAVADGDGGWYLGGTFTSVGGVARPGLAHLRSDGSLDPSFAPPSLGQIRALALAGGTLYVGGVTGRGASIAPVLVALDATSGARSGTAFAPMPIATDTPTGVLALLASGVRLYAGFGPDGVAAYADGGGAPVWRHTFSSVPVQATGAAALALDGSALLVGGRFDDGANTNLESLSVTTSGITSIVVAAGEAYVARPGSSGIGLVDLDTGSWRPWGTISASTLALDGTTLYVSGRTSSDLRYTERVYASPSSGVEPVLRPVSPALDGVGATLVPGGNGRLLVGGSFAGAGGAARSNLAAFDLGSGTLLPWHPVADGPVTALAAAGQTLYVGGHFTHVDGASRDGLAAIGPTGSVLPWRPSANGVDALAVANGRAFAGGSFVLGAPKPVPGRPLPFAHLAAFSAPGSGTFLWTSSATTWNVDALTVWRGTVLAAGPSVVALRAGGTGRRALWHRSTNGEIVALATQANTLYLGGRFTSLDGLPRANLAALALDRGGAPLPFAPRVPPTIEALAAGGDELVYSSTGAPLGAVGTSAAGQVWQLPGSGYATGILAADGG